MKNSRLAALRAGSSLVSTIALFATFLDGCSSSSTSPGPQAAPEAGAANEAGGGGASEGGDAGVTDGGGLAEPGGAGGGASTTCEPGFTEAPGGECVRTKACATENGGCHTFATCTESVSPDEPPVCKCKDGYSGDGVSCAPVVTTVSTGHSFACAIAGNEALWCWGQNESGQLGNGAQQRVVAAPTVVSGELKWEAVSAGYAHACGISEGALYCWGSNEHGALGLGDAGKETARNRPTRVGSAGDWTAVSAGVLHTCGIRGDGALYCWGTHAGFASAQTTPSRIGSASGWTQVASGGRHTCGLLNGAPYCWGSNLLDSLGIGADGPSEVEIPKQVHTGTDWVELTADNLSTCGLRKTGQLYCWGLQSQIPEVGALNAASVPTRVGTWADWTGFSLRDPGGCGLRANGEVWCFGSSSFGQRGDATQEPAERTLTKALNEASWTAVRSGSEFACALKAGALSCWGRHQLGQLGVGDALVSTVSSPTRVGASNGWTHVAVGRDLSCGLEAGDVYCWGDRQILRYPAEPTRVTMDGSWTDLSLGPSIVGHRFEQLWWWRFSPSNGSNGYPAESDPQREGSGTNWRSVRTSADYDGPTCAIDGSQDTLFCYGPRNSRGELGVGDTEPRSTPTQVGVAKGWESISPGELHTCGVRAGLLYCWGGNASGQLGLGNAKVGANQLTPQTVGGTAGWTAVASGSFHTCGIRGGSLYCWGEESRGLLGLGEVSAGTYAAPTQVGDLSDWASISVAQASSCATRSSGELYCWGYNASGQLGLGDDVLGIAVSTPQRVGADKTWSVVGTARDHTCAIKTDGTLWCWGSNRSGELGLGPSWSDTPMPVAWQ